MIALIVTHLLLTVFTWYQVRWYYSDSIFNPDFGDVFLTVCPFVNIIIGFVLLSLNMNEHYPDTTIWKMFSLKFFGLKDVDHE